MISTRYQNRLLKIAVFFLLVYNGILIWQYHDENLYYCNSEIPFWEQDIDFANESFNNETGISSGIYLVPNYIHFIRFNNPYITYVQMICILAAFKNQKPDKIYFHRNFNYSFKGKYWDVLINVPGFLEKVVFEYVPMPDNIFDQPLDPDYIYTPYHAADITRVRVMMKYGGIILDMDTYIVNNLNYFRTFEMTLNWDDNQFLATQLLIAHKDARFLNLYLESYRGAYDRYKWYYNAGERPTIEVLHKQPELVHRVKMSFGAHTMFIMPLFQREFKYWRCFYAFHLLINHQYLLHNITELAVFPVEFDEENIVNYPITFRQMAFDVYDIAKVPWSKEQPLIQHER